MDYYKLPIIPMVVCLSIGIALETLYSIDLALLWCLTSSGLACFVFFHFYNFKKKKQYILHSVTIYFLFINFGALLSKNNYGLTNENHFSKQNKIDKIEGIFTEKLRSSNQYLKFYTAIESCNGNEASGKLLIYLSKDKFKNVEVGNEFVIQKSPEFLVSNSNPYQFDYVNYLNKQNIFHKVKILKSNEIDIKQRLNFYSMINICRNEISQIFNHQSFSSEHANLLRGLILGERTEIDKQLNEVYIDAGIIHILAISGMHIALIYSSIISVLGFLKKSKNGHAIIFYTSLILLWFYAFLTGFSASVVRAVVLITFMTINKHIGRQYNVYNTLGLTAFFSLLFEPNYLFDAGFQLSFMATLSIIATQDLLKKYTFSKHKWLSDLKSMLGVTVVAQIGVLPLTLYYFGKFPLLFMFSNLIAILISDWLVKIGFLFIFLHFIPFLSTIVANILNFGITILNRITFYFASLDFFIIEQISFHMILLVLGFVVMYQLFHFFESHFKKRQFIYFLSSILLFQMGYLWVIYQNSTSSEFIIMNAMKSQLIISKKYNEVIVFANDSVGDKDKIDGYKKGVFAEKVQSKRMQKLFYHHGKIALIDSTRIYVKSKVSYLILSQSAKINLERVLQETKPKYVIADGSNYQSTIQLWKSTCDKNKIPFHATAEKGYFKIE